MKAPRIGELRRRITIESAADVSDGAGGAVRTWVTGDTVFAEVEPRRRRERVDDGRLVGVVTHRIVMRWRDDVTGAIRLAEGDARYRVLAVEALDPHRRFLSCLCEEEQP